MDASVLSSTAANTAAAPFACASSVKTIGFTFGKSADTQLFENCLNILKTEHKKRSRPDVVMLLSLLKGNAFFSKLDYEVKLEVRERVYGTSVSPQRTYPYVRTEPC